MTAQTPDAADLAWQAATKQYAGQRQKLLANVNREANAGPFKSDWESLKQYRIPEWYQDAKFGIFIHWGVYAVPAFDNEWYPRNMYLKGDKVFQHHIATFGPQTQFGYKDFIPKFKAEKFDAKTWADLFRRSGAKFVVPVAEHHDGFALYDSALSRWTSAQMGPKRDIVGELTSAFRRAGLHAGASSHRAEHYFFMNGGRAFSSDVQDPKYADFYGPAHAGPTNQNKFEGHPDPAYLDDWLARTAELISKIPS